MERLIKESAVIKETALGIFRDAFSLVKVFQSRALSLVQWVSAPCWTHRENAGSAGWSPAGGKAGRTGYLQTRPWSQKAPGLELKRGFHFPLWQKQDEQCRPQTSREGQPSQPLRLSKRLSRVGLELEGTRHQEPEAQPEVEAGVTSFTASWRGLISSLWV